jgi:hypothetical protein
MNRRDAALERSAAMIASWSPGTSSVRPAEFVGHDGSRKRSFTRHSRSRQRSRWESCNECRVRGNVTRSGSSRYSPAHANRLGRVSTRDHHPEAQYDALRAAGCDEVFIDKASGKLARRPELDRALLSANRTGDQLVITKLGRLGRSLEHLIELSND